jgi:hypothetical protein
MKRLRPLGPLCALLLSTGTADAFCGFFVSGADASLYNSATRVVIMREGTRTVLNMQNDYVGPLADFAMVVPVPVVLQKDQVKTLPKEVFDRVDKLTAPRLVEYWEQDPCPSAQDKMWGDAIGDSFGAGGLGLSGVGMGGSGLGVTVQAQYSVGEYDIQILGAQDASGLDRWLRSAGYKIPVGAEEALRPYVQAGMKFFVARVNAQKVTFDGGKAVLSPLRFHYDTDKFSLPVKLGLLNSAGTQDLIVNVLSRAGRVQVANTPNVTIPTNLEVKDSTRSNFGGFYASLLDKTMSQSPGAVVTEYAWSATTCDPCPEPPLTPSELATLGADVMPPAIPSTMGAMPKGAGAPLLGAGGSIRTGNVSVQGRLPREVVERIVRQNFGRFRMCYEQGLRRNPALVGSVAVDFRIDRSGAVQAVSENGASTMPDAQVRKCVADHFKNLSFPQPEGGTVSVTVPVVFSTPPAPGSATVLPSAAGSAPTGSDPSGFTVTRLHARYNKASLGADLTFAVAPGIVGGREQWATEGVLEAGAQRATQSAFQGRYVIRHPWTGAIKCQNPRRGVWGGNPNGRAGAQATATLATNMSFAAPTPVDAAGLLKSALPTGNALGAPLTIPGPPDPAGSAAAPASPSASAEPATASSAPPMPTPRVAPKSGCNEAGGAPGLAAAGFLGLLALLRTRRRR